MPRAANPYYVDSDPYPTNQAVTSMGQSLGTALFGDPQAAQEQRLKVAQAQTAAAEADNYRATAAKTAAETTGLGLQNDATANLGATFGDLFGPDGKLDYHKWARASAGAVASHNTEALKGLDRVVAQFGNEDEARRVLIGNAVNPSDNFAASAERADTIAATAAAKKKLEADSVANINGAFGVKEAGIHAGAEVKAAGIGADAARFGHQLAYNAATRDTDVRSGDERYKVDHGTANGITPTLAGGIDSEINAQTGYRPNPKDKTVVDPIPAPLKTLVRQRAGQIYLQTHDTPGSVSQALSELTTVTAQHHIGAWIPGIGGQDRSGFSPRPTMSGRAPISSFDRGRPPARR